MGFRVNASNCVPVTQEVRGAYCTTQQSALGWPLRDTRTSEEDPRLVLTWSASLLKMASSVALQKKVKQCSGCHPERQRRICF